MQPLVNQEAEKALIASALADPVNIPLDVRPEEFYNIDHQKIWKAILEEEHPDIITVADKTGLPTRTISAVAIVDAPYWKIDEFAKIVKKDAALRKIIYTCQEGATKAIGREDVNDLVAGLIRDLDKLTSVSGAGRSLAEGASEAMDYILKNIERRHLRERIDYGLDCGIEVVNNAFKGLKPGWLVFFAGPPAVGKSALALQVGMVFARQAPGCYVALEMNEASLMYRAYGIKTGTDNTKVEFGEVDSNLVISAYSEMEELDMEVFCPPRLSIQEFKAYIAKQKADRGIKWVILDYVSLLDVPRTQDKVADDEYLSQELRKIASEFEVLVFGLDSVTKAGASGYMTIDAIRGSFTKQHDADISFGYSQYRGDKVDKDRSRHCRVLGVLKDRHRGNGGKTAILELRDGLISEYQEREEYVADDYTV